jgi:hypothetical protein
VPFLAAEFAVDLGIAGTEQCVVDAGRRVLDEGQHRPPAARDEHGADPDAPAAVDRARVLHGEVLERPGGGERPGVQHLRAVRVDHLDQRARREPNGAALPRGYAFEGFL